MKYLLSRDFEFTGGVVTNLQHDNNLLLSWFALGRLIAARFSSAFTPMWVWLSPENKQKIIKAIKEGNFGKLYVKQNILTESTTDPRNTFTVLSVLLLYKKFGTN